MKEVLLVIVACSFLAHDGTASVSGQAERRMNKEEFALWRACYQRSEPRHRRCLRTATDQHTLVQLEICSRRTIRHNYSPGCDKLRDIWLRECAGEAIYCKARSEQC
jgi:hypothetical protein